MEKLVFQMRESDDRDQAEIEAVEEAAFGRPEDANLDWREDVLSLVAFKDGIMIGLWIIFDSPYPQVCAVG